MHNILDITFDFEFGLLNNRAMKVIALYENNKFEATPTNPSIKINQIKIPNKVEIEFSGKTNRDTIVDANGNILQDMYVKIIGIKLDLLKVPTWVIEKKLSYVTSKDQTLTTSFIGFNGIMTFDMPETNIFSLYRRLNKDV